MRYSSAIITLAPWPAAIRAARTPPEPPPITNRSTSNSAMASSEWRMANGKSNCDALSIRYSLFAISLLSDLLAALAHLGAEFAVDDFGELLRPIVHIGEAEIDGRGFGGQKLLAQGRLVEGGEVPQFLLGKRLGV